MLQSEHMPPNEYKMEVVLRQIGAVFVLCQTRFVIIEL